MKIENKSNKRNYLNFKSGGFTKRVEIPASKVVDVPALTDLSQVLNLTDFKLGRLGVVAEVVKEVSSAENTEEAKEKAKTKTSKSKKSSTTKSKKTKSSKSKEESKMEKVEREVKGYTGNEEQEK